jgi:hypothetical protein
MIRPFTKADQTGGSNFERKAKRLAAKKDHERKVHQQVDTRDRMCCRVCGHYSSPMAVGVLERAHRHHLVYRSHGGKTETANLLTLCAKCHNEVHVDHTLSLEGNADLRSAEGGKLCGVKCQRFGESGWRVIGWV